MWFKNLLIYRISDWKSSAAKLGEALAHQSFQRCGSLDMTSCGWLAPKGEGDALVHTLDGRMLIALGIEKKLLPATVINQYAKDRADEIGEQQGYAPGRKQLREIKEQVTDELLPRAFGCRRTIFAWIDPAGGWFVVDSANAAKAEELLDTLKKSIDGLSFSLIETKLSPVVVMTDWLGNDEAPPGFTIDRDCELLAPGDEKATVRYVRHPLESGDVRNHITAGKQVTKLAMTWDERISFVLHENLQVKRVAFLDILKDQSERESESADELFDADFAIMSGELSRFLPDLLDALGGEA